MSCWPLIERELRQAMRRGRCHRHRLFTAAAAAGVASLFLMYGAATGTTSGATLHVALFVIGLYLAIIQTGEIAAGLFVQERQHGTYGLLFLSGLSPVGVFLGKLLGGLVGAAYGLLALVPILAVPFVMGGVSVELFLLTVITLPILLLLALMCGVLGSMLSDDDAQARFLAFVILAVICGAPVVLHAADRLLGSATLPELTSLSPAYAPFLIVQGLPAGQAATCLQSLTVAGGWSVLLLGASSLLLLRHWRIQVKGPDASRWRELLGQARLGSGDWRRRLRQTKLEQNPLIWFTLRDRSPALYAMLSLGAVLLLWLVGWVLWPQVWQSAGLILVFGLLSLLVLDGQVSFASARQLATGRRDGALELLLTTPLSPAEIVDGQLSALQERFAPVVKVQAVVLLMFLMVGALNRQWIATALLNYLVLWAWLFFLLFRTGRMRNARPMWVAMNTGQMGYLLRRQFATNGIWLGWLLYQVFQRVSRTAPAEHIEFAFPTGSTGETIIVLVASAIAVTVVCLFKASAHEGVFRRRLVEDFRAIAMQPVPAAGDPRLKGWDGESRLPSA